MWDSWSAKLKSMLGVGEAVMNKTERSPVLGEGRLSSPPSLQESWGVVHTQLFGSTLFTAVRYSFSFLVNSRFWFLHSEWSLRFLTNHKMIKDGESPGGYLCCPSSSFWAHPPLLPQFRAPGASRRRNRCHHCFKMAKASVISTIMTP